MGWILKSSTLLGTCVWMLPSLFSCKSLNLCLSLKLTSVYCLEAVAKLLELKSAANITQCLWFYSLLLVYSGLAAAAVVSQQQGLQKCLSIDEQGVSVGFGQLGCTVEGLCLVPASMKGENHPFLRQVPLYGCTYWCCLLWIMTYLSNLQILLEQALLSVSSKLHSLFWIFTSPWHVWGGFLISVAKYWNLCMLVLNHKISIIKVYCVVLVYYINTFVTHFKWYGLWNLPLRIMRRSEEALFQGMGNRSWQKFWLYLKVQMFVFYTKSQMAEKKAQHQYDRVPAVP